ncbi:MAG: ASKHA domain-containing protein [Candidatus Omnitrophota bacterium]
MDFKVLFQPEGIVSSGLPGLTVLELARRANIGITAFCGGRGTCGKCQVKVEPAPAPNESEKKHITPERLKEGYRLACQTKIIDSDLTVLVPPESRFFNLKILVSGLTRDIKVHTSIRKYYLQLQPPTIEDQRPDWERMKSAISTSSGFKENDLTASIYLLRRLPAILRTSDFKITAVLEEKRLISVEPGDTAGQSFGLAFDLGTTTIVGSLLDIGSAREIAVSSRLNPQSAYGADVISRINHTITEKNGSETLQQVVVESFNEIITELCQKSGVSPENIYEIMLVGNTAMEHLFLGLPAGALATSPYVGVHQGSISLPAKKLGLAVNHDAVLRVGPLISGFVGGDTVAGILATNQHHERALRLFIDIGTNGEIVVGNREGVWCTSAAAGPAFEGANIHFGMRAEPGAIDKVKITERVLFSTIMEKTPRGICGTGLVEGIGELLRCRIISEDGRLKSREDLAGLPKEILDRLQTEKGERRFVLSPETGIAIFQKDIRQLQLAKAAIAAGIQTLLAKIPISLAELDEILLAGAFGSYIDPETALRLGLLPPVPLEKIRFVGNTALTGSKMMLLSQDMKDEAENIPVVCRYVELFHEKGFMDLFVENLSFPNYGLP